MAMAVQDSVLEELNRACTPFTSYQSVASALAIAADEERSDTEADHLHAPCAAMLFFTQPDGTFRGDYMGPGPEPWPRRADELSPDVHAVWSAYADAASHPTVRARLHHLLWTIRHGDRPVTHLQAAIAGYRQAVPGLLTGTEPLVTANRWTAGQALRAAHTLAVATRQPELGDIVTEMLGLADTALGWPEHAPGVVCAMTEPLLADKMNHTQLRPLLERAIDHYRNDSHSHIAFLDQLRRTEPDPDAQRQIDERIVAAATTNADQLSGLAKLTQLEEAAVLARDRGLADALDRIRRTQQKLTPKDLELTPIVTSLQLPTHLIDAARAVIDEAADLEQGLQTIAATTPALADPTETDQHGLIRLPTALLNLNGPVVTAVSDTESPTGQHLIDTRVLSLDLHGLLVAAQLDRINERFAPTQDQLLALLERPPLAPAARMRGLARAFMAFWDHDDDVAIALVLPRIEGLLRRRLQAADVPVIQHAKGDRPGQVSQLGTLIMGMEAAGYPHPWPTVFRALIGGPEDGMNLRNNVLHDLVDTPPRHRIALALQASLAVFLLLPEDDERTSTS
ncbi:hypothetical protein [Streptomyces sp. NPDC002133]|uniref:DUF7380 domain-containing protein n=1 Tax=Streptomyces sp. NPDC002133 TaxID=3154409 RepID=UPI003319CA57